MYRYVLIILLPILAAACRHAADEAHFTVVNLIRELDRAEKRPPAGFQVAPREAGGVTRPSIVMPVPSRATWDLPLPRNGIFRSFVALDTAPGAPPAPVRFRFGVSDDRIYEALADITVAPDERGWIDLRLDLSAYAGWKWSLFYRPERITWHVVLATDTVTGAPGTAVWGEPTIATDTQSAREYAARRRAM
jgi:hypothetical protein